MRAAHVDFRLAMQKLLTPEQREKAAAMRHGPGHGEGGFGGDDECGCGGKHGGGGHHGAGGHGCAGGGGGAW
jgi:hypothetical protein